MPVSTVIASIPWNDGTDDHFYLNFSDVVSGEDDIVKVSSDYNETGKSRSRTMMFQASEVDDPVIQAPAVVTFTQSSDNTLQTSLQSTTNSVYSDGEIHGKFGQAIKY